MDIKIYNGLLSDSNSFIVFDTNEVSFKAGLYKLAKWIENYFVNYRQQEDDFNWENPSDEYMEEESDAGIWIINGHTIFASYDEIISTVLKDKAARHEADQVDFLDNTFGRGYEILVRKNK